MVGIDRIMSEGRALTNCIGNGVATMVIAEAGQGERDDERFQAVLRDPSMVEDATERALRGETRLEEEDAELGGRFERERERDRGGVVLER